MSRTTTAPGRLARLWALRNRLLIRLSESNEDDVDRVACLIHRIERRIAEGGAKTLCDAMCKLALIRERAVDAIDDDCTLAAIDTLRDALRAGFHPTSSDGNGADFHRCEYRA